MSPALASASDLETARDFAIQLEARERRRGASRHEARRRVAADLGIAPGTLETIVRRRLKRIEGWVLRNLARATIADLMAEIRRHETLLHRAETFVVELDPDEVSALRADIARARQNLAALGASPRPAATETAQAAGARTPAPRSLA